MRTDSIENVRRVMTQGVLRKISVRDVNLISIHSCGCTSKTRGSHDSEICMGVTRGQPTLVFNHNLLRLNTYSPGMYYFPPSTSFPQSTERIRRAARLGKSPWLRYDTTLPSIVLVSKHDSQVTVDILRRSISSTTIPSFIYSFSVDRPSRTEMRMTMSVP